MRSSVGEVWHAAAVNERDECQHILGLEDWTKLERARADIAARAAPAYDEVLHEVSARIRATGSIGKSDIRALLLWKRLQANARWVSDLMVLEDEYVRGVTTRAVAAAQNVSLSVPEAASAGRGALSSLPGFQSGDARASALLFAAAPERLAVYDRRAHVGLARLGLTLTKSRGRYGRYMSLVEDLREVAQDHGCNWSARDVDLALYQLGG